jgi:hypothetical protein
MSVFLKWADVRVRFSQLPWDFISSGLNSMYVNI